MNKPAKHIKYFLISIVVVFCSSWLLGQSKPEELPIPITKAIDRIEDSTDYIFNYDPSLLAGYTCYGQLELSTVEETLDKVFYNSPLLYELQGNTVLVYLPNPESYRICGSIIDALSEEPLVAANIAVLDTTIGIQSDDSGYFEFDFKGYKNQEVAITYLGYQPIRFSLQDIKNNTCPTFRMEVNEAIFRQEIIISDYLLDGIALGEEYTGFKLDFDQLSNSHSNVEHDILKTAQLLPGINSIDDSASNLQIRGSNPGQNLVLWEGVPLYNAGHVFGMVSAINPFSVEEVSIYKGAYDPKYDNRVGGILDISLADDLPTGFHGSVGTTFTELHSNLSIPLVKDQVSLEIAGRQSINKLFDSPTLQSYTDKVFQFSIIDDQASDMNLNTEQTLAFHDWNAKVLYRPSSKVLVNAGFYSNAQDFTYAFWFDEGTFLSQDNINLNTQIISLESEVVLTEDWTTSLSLYQSSYSNEYDKREFEEGITIYANDQVNAIQELSATFSNDIKLGSKSQLRLGYEYNSKAVTLDLGDVINFDASFVPNESEQGSFHNLFQSISYAGKRLQVDGGNRSSYYQEVDKWFHSPRINLQYVISDHLRLKSDAGIYHQFISQLTNLGAEQIRVDNPLWILNASGQSLSQQADKMALGAVYQKDKWLLDIDAYYNRTSNITTLGPQLGILGDIGGFEKGSSRVIGIDCLVKKRWSAGISTWLSYSLGQAQYDFPDISDEAFAAPNDIRHTMSLVTNYKYKGFQVSVNTNYHSGLPYSLGIMTLNEEEPNAEPPFLYYLRYDAFNSERLDRYLRLDLNLAYRFDLKPSKPSGIEVSCSLLNLLDRTNVVAREYYVDYTDTTEEYSLKSIQKALLDRTALVLLRYYW